MDFAWGVRNGYLTYRTGGTASTSFVDNGTDRGSCYLTCHGEGHNPESYTGTVLETVNCLQCHATHP
jgi:hypothetical protein